MARLPDFLNQCLLATLGALLCVLLLCPTQSESGAIGITQYESEKAGLEENIIGAAALGGEYHSKDEITRRNNILREINETADTQELEDFLQVIRAKQAKDRGRRETHACTFEMAVTQEFHGTCYYGFGTFVTCKAGQRLSFDASDCPATSGGT